VYYAQTDTITVTEKIHELFEQKETVMSCQKTRRVHIVNKSRHLQHLWAVDYRISIVSIVKL
jgi:hypothetical protein